jgi:hypothetical protein
LKRAVTTVVSLAVVTLSAVVALYPRYHAARELANKKRTIVEALAKDAAVTETLLKMELETTGVTYRELFAFCDKSVDQRNALIVDMRVGTTILPPSTSAAVIEFLNAENGFARAKSAFFAASLALDSALQARNEQGAEFNAEAARGSRFASPPEDATIDQLNAALQQAEESSARLHALLRERPQLDARLKEAANGAAESISAFRAACELLVLKERKLASEMSASGMPFRPVFALYYERSIEKANEAEKNAAIAK